MHDLLIDVWHHVHVDVHSQGHIGYFDGVVEQGNAPVAVDYAFLTQTEDVLRAGIGLGNDQLPGKHFRAFRGFLLYG